MFSYLNEKKNCSICLDWYFVLQQIFLGLWNKILRNSGTETMLQSVGLSPEQSRVGTLHAYGNLILWMNLPELQNTDTDLNFVFFK